MFHVIAGFFNSKPDTDVVCESMMEALGTMRDELKACSELGWQMRRVADSHCWTDDASLFFVQITVASWDELVARYGGAVPVVPASLNDEWSQFSRFA